MMPCNGAYVAACQRVLRWTQRRLGCRLGCSGEATATRMTRLLEIFVMPDCEGCEAAIRLADRVRERNVPGVDLRVIDLSVSGAERPENVFAVPTYLLEGAVLSLGNPEEEWLLAQLAPGDLGRRETLP